MRSLISLALLLFVGCDSGSSIDYRQGQYMYELERRIDRLEGKGKTEEVKIREWVKPTPRPLESWETCEAFLMRRSYKYDVPMDPSWPCEKQFRFAELNLCGIEDITGRYWQWGHNKEMHDFKCEQIKDPSYASNFWNGATVAQEGLGIWSQVRE